MREIFRHKVQHKNKSMSQKYRTTPPLNPYLQDLISNSPFLLPYISFKTGLENLMLGEMTSLSWSVSVFSSPACLVKKAVIIILPNKVVISLHPSYFSPIFVLQEFFFPILNFGFVCHKIRNNTERDRIYFCKGRWIMNFSNILLSSLKTEIFWTGTQWNLYDPALKTISEVEKVFFCLISVYIGNYYFNYYYYYYFGFFFNNTGYFHISLFCREYLDLVSFITRSGYWTGKLYVFQKVSRLKRLIHLYSISLNPDMILT